MLEVSLDVGGIPVRVSDTAGLRHLMDTGTALDTVEQIGIERAKRAVEEADLRLCVVSLENLGSSIIDDEVARLLSPDTAVFLNKLDKARPEDIDRARQLFADQRIWIGSIVNEKGMGAFVQGLAELLKERYAICFSLEKYLLTVFRPFVRFENGSQDEEPLITHARHRTHMNAALRYLEASLSYGSLLRLSASNSIDVEP